jgi:hypothetical protein
MRGGGGRSGLGAAGGVGSLVLATVERAAGDSGAAGGLSTAQPAATPHSAAKVRQTPTHLLLFMMIVQFRRQLGADCSDARAGTTI